MPLRISIRGRLQDKTRGLLLSLEGKLHSERGFMTLIPHCKPHAILLALVILMSASTASAQDYLGSYLQSQQDANIREIQQGRSEEARRATAGRTVSPARLAEVKARLRADYDRRVREQGQARADQWLRDTARRIGQR